MSEGQQRFFRLLSLVVALVVLTFVIVTANPREVWETLKRVEPGTAVATMLLNLPVVALFTLRSRLVLDRMGYSVPLSVLAPASVLGNVAGALTPAASGELLRASALQRNAGLSFQDGLSLVAYERLFSTYLLALSTLACLAATSLAPAAGIAFALVCAGCALLPWALATFIVRELPSAESIRRPGLVFDVLRYVLGMAGQVWSLLKDLRLTAGWSTLTVLSFALVALQFHLAARSAGVELDLLDAWVTFGGAGLAAIASLLPLGLGIGDGSIAAIITATGVPFDEATAVAVLIRATVTLPLIVLAAASYFYLLRSAPASSSQASSASTEREED